MSQPAEFPIEASPTTQNLGVWDAFYENRTDTERPPSERYGMPPRPTVISLDETPSEFMKDTLKKTCESTEGLCCPVPEMKFREGAV